MGWELKPECEAFRVMDGPDAGKKYEHGWLYSDCPHGYADKFEEQESVGFIEVEDADVLDALPAAPKAKTDAWMDEADQARQVLAATRPSKLKRELDHMGVEYPANADKATLVELLLENSAPVPTDEAMTFNQGDK